MGIDITPDSIPYLRCREQKKATWSSNSRSPLFVTGLKRAFADPPGTTATQLAHNAYSWPFAGVKKGRPLMVIGVTNDTDANEQGPHRK